MQKLKQVDPGFAGQQDVPFYSKSAFMSVALNALARPTRKQKPSVGRLEERTEPGVANRISSVPTSAGFAALLSAFRATGGVVRGNELAMMLEDLKMGDLASLGRAMAEREICSFQWRSAFWIPMFQFDLDNLSFKPGPRRILQELSGVLDEWMLTAWFAQPNSWLSGCKPVDLLASNWPAVHEAARADRCVAAG